MRTFKWTVPEPAHRDESAMAPRDAIWWQRVRARGIEWYVVSKGLFFLAAYPLLAHGCFAESLAPERLVEGFVLGLCAGLAVWSWRERRYQRAIEEGIIAPG
jgi:hypothetical protein